jgi:RNA polymerase sigma factor (sigma-70 family)
MGTETTHQVDDLLKRFCAGDVDARRLLIERGLRRLAVLSRRQLRDFPAVQRWTQADDIQQGAAQRLYRALGSVRPADAREFFRLCSTMIRRELIDQKRSLCGPLGVGANHVSDPHHTGTAPPHVDQFCPDDSTHDPAKLARWTELHARIDALPEVLREVFDLVWYQELTHAEAALILDVSVKTVSRRWREARLLVHELVEDGEI